MSKEKVDEYREQKKHRKENLKKERARKKAEKAISAIVGAACVIGIVAALGVTGFNTWKASQPETKDYSSTSQIVSDLSGITSTEEETEAAEAEAAETEAAETEAAETEAAETETTAQ